MRAKLCLRVAVAAGALILGAVPAHAAPSTTGTLDLREGTPASTVAYAWEGAPLLTGPGAAARLGLSGPAIRMSATRYVPVTLRAMSRPSVALGSGDCSGSLRRPVAQTVAISDPRALLAVESVALNVLRGRGWAQVELALVGAGPLELGEYVAPGVLRVTTHGCTDLQTGATAPFHDVTDLRAVRVLGGDGLLSRFAPEMLEGERVRLRFADGAWRGTLALADPGTAGYPSYPATSAQLQISLSGTPAELNAQCKVPSAMSWPGTTVRRRRAALSLLRRAGFTRPYYAGVRRGIARGMRGRYVVVDPSTTSLPCNGRLPFRLGRR